jgi:predicted metalloprotease with PDZ domain
MDKRMDSGKSNSGNTIILYFTRQYIFMLSVPALRFIFRFTATFAGIVSAILCMAGTPETKNIHFTVSVEKPASHLYHVQFEYEPGNDPVTVFKMPVWTTGYYQLMSFAEQVINFKVTDSDTHALSWEKKDNSWKINNPDRKKVLVSYDVKAERAFVASNYVDEKRGYLSPAGVFMHPQNRINMPVTVTVVPYRSWTTVATGMEPVKNRAYTYTASDFDILYDSPILMGDLETLPVFEVKGVPHYFIGYDLGNFDRRQFVADMKKIVESAVAIIGDIPYKHYTFLSIGPGAGGIEHLNSSSISFSGQSLAQPASRQRVYSFLSHEYFHHFNVKRIRPIELGPFDYDNGSRTKMLWVSEGITVYYEYLILRRAGLITEQDVWQSIRSKLLAYESKPGRVFQSLTDASYNTWSDGPFGRTGDEVNKTISYYDKGPVIGAMLDLAIRHASKNRQSLDDVMRTLYYDYYLKKQRGFTEAEFREVCEKAAGGSLQELFEYTTTVKEPDYRKYFGYAGLSIDVEPKTVPAYLGITVRERNDTVTVTDVDYESPAWKKGIRRRDMIVSVNGVSIRNAAAFRETTANRSTGETLELGISRQQKEELVNIILGYKAERSFEIKPDPNASPEAVAIRREWLRDRH